MKIEGKMVDIILKLDPKLHKKYTQIENNKKVFYVKHKKVLYVTLQDAKLFWKILPKH